MTLRQALALAIKALRKAKNLTQEDFGIVSSRTYLSTLERGLKSPTLDKLEDISNVLGVPPLSLLLLTYAIKTGQSNYEEAVDAIANDARAAIYNAKLSGFSGGQEPLK